jgi:hypothetical protein
MTASWNTAWLVLAAALLAQACESGDDNGGAPPAAGMGGAVAGAAGADAGGAGAGGAGAVGMAGSMAGAAGMDPCMRAVNEAMTRDVSQIGPLAMCIPPGVALACRIESPMYTCNPMPSADPAAMNKCRNTSDCAVLMEINNRSAMMMGPKIANIVRECGLPYLSQTTCEPVVMGTTECIATRTNEIMAPGLSPDCASCFISSLLCNLKCLMHCSLDAESPACIACMHAEGCRGLFYQCSGLEPMN